MWGGNGYNTCVRVTCMRNVYIGMPRSGSLSKVVSHLWTVGRRLPLQHPFVPTVILPYKLNIHTVLYCPPFCLVVSYMPPPQYMSDACMVLTNFPQNIDDFLLSTGQYSVSRGTKAQKNVKGTEERIMKNWPRGTGCQSQSTSVQRTCVQKKWGTGRTLYTQST